MPFSFRTGRTRTLRFEGEWTGDAAKIEIYSVPHGPPGIYYGFTDLAAYGPPIPPDPAWFFEVEAYGAVKRGPTDPPDKGTQYGSPIYDILIIGWSIGVGVRAKCNLAGSVVEDIDFGGEVVYNGSIGNYSVGYGAGTWVAEVETEEWVEVQDVDPTDIDEDGYPKFAGAAQKDGLTFLPMRFYERIPPGAAFTISSSAGGASASVTGTTTQYHEIPYVNNNWGQNYLVPHGYIVERRIFARNFMKAMTASATLDAYNANFDPPFGQTVLWDGGTRQWTTSSAVAGTNATVTLTAGGNSLDETDARCLLHVDLMPPLGYALDARMRAMQNAYPGGLRIVWSKKKDGWASVLCAPTGTDGVWQTFLYARAYHGLEPTGFEYFWGRDDRQPIRTHMERPSMISAGEDDRDWVTLIRGKAFHALTLTHDSTYTVDNANPANWTAGANTTVGGSAGAMTMAVSGGTGSASRAFATAIKAESYRYLRVRLSIDSGTGPAQVSINGKTWDITVTTTPTDYYLDLCCPNNSTYTVCDKDSRLPLVSPTDQKPLDEPEGWGINRIPGITIGNLSDGRTYTLALIDFYRYDPAKVSYASGFLKWRELFDDDDGTDWRYRQFLIGDVDGRVALEVPDSQRRLIGQGYRHDILPIDVARSYITTNFTGWNATLSGSYPDSFHNPGLPAMCLGGDGGLYRAGAWTFGLYTDPGTVYAQMLWHQVMGYPGIGDAWAGGAYPTDPALMQLPVRVCKTLRGSAWGTVHKNDDSAWEGAVIAVTKDVGGAPGGGASTGVRGAFRTGSPHGVGNADYTTKLTSSNPMLSDSATWDNRVWERTAFRAGLGASGAGWVQYDQLGGLHEAIVRDSEIEYRYSQYSVPDPDWDIVTTVTNTGDCSDPRFIIEGRHQRIILLYTRETAPNTFGVYQRHSDDRGATWSSETLAFTNGRRATISVFGNGPMAAVARFAFKYNSGSSGPGKIYRTYQGQGDQSPSAEATIKNSAGVALEFEDDSFHVIASPDGAGRALLHCRISGETDSSDWISADEGQTWIRL